RDHHGGGGGNRSSAGTRAAARLHRDAGLPDQPAGAGREADAGTPRVCSGGGAPSPRTGGCFTSPWGGGGRPPKAVGWGDSFAAIVCLVTPPRRAARADPPPPGEGKNRYFCSAAASLFRALPTDEILINSQCVRGLLFALYDPHISCDTNSS